MKILNCYVIQILVCRNVEAIEISFYRRKKNMYVSRKQSGRFKENNRKDTYNSTQNDIFEM